MQAPSTLLRTGLVGILAQVDGHKALYYIIFGNVILGIILDNRRGARVDDRGVSKTVVVLAGHRVPCGVGRDESALSAKKIIR